MTKEQKDKILKALAEDRNDYARDCDRRIAEEQGKIIGADYMLQRFLDVLKTELEPQGEWIYKQYGGYSEQGDWCCSECGFKYNYGQGKAKYCPNCGCRMVEPQERSNKE